MQLIRGNGQTPVCITVAVQSAFYALDVESRETEPFQHGKEILFLAVPSGPVRIPSRRGIIPGELFYQRFHQGFTMRFAVAAEGEQERLGEIVKDHSLTVGFILCAFNEGQSTVCSGVAATVNLRLVPVRRLVREIAYNSLLDPARGP